MRVGVALPVTRYSPPNVSRSPGSATVPVTTRSICLNTAATGTLPALPTSAPSNDPTTSARRSPAARSDQRSAERDPCDRSHPVLLRARPASCGDAVARSDDSGGAAGVQRLCRRSDAVRFAGRRRRGADPAADAVRSTPTGRSGERLLEPGLPRPARRPLDASARLVAELRVEARRLEVVRVEHDGRAAARPRLVLGGAEQSTTEAGRDDTARRSTGTRPSRSRPT